MGRGLGVPKEAGVHTGVAESECLAVHTYLPVLERAYDIVSGVHQGKQIAAVLETHQVGDGQEGFQGAVAGPRALPREGGIDTYGAVLDGHDRIGHAQRAAPSTSRNTDTFVASPQPEAPGRSVRRGSPAATRSNCTFCLRR